MTQIKQGYKQTEIGVLPEDWNVAPMSELTNLMTNGFVGTAKTHYTDSRDGVIYIQGYNVEENSFNYKGIKKVTPAFHLKNSKSCLRTGDVLMVQTGDVGLTTVVPPELEGSNCHALIINRFKSNHCSHFFSYYLNSNLGRSRLKELETGTTMKHINVGDLLHFLIPLPPTLAEQEKIASVLSDMDDYIVSLEGLIEKKRNIKQGAMQKLLNPFDDNGEIKQGWQEKCLGDVLKIRHGKSQHEVTDSMGIYPILATGGCIGFTNKFLYNKPSVLIGRKGTIDKPQYIDKPFWTIDTLFYSEINKDNHAKYLYYKFCLIDWYSYNEASGVPSLNAKSIEAIEFFTPSYNQQKSIAQTLSDMDTEIDALTIKHTKAKDLKQGMMQKLLTGQIRLVKPSTIQQEIAA